MTDNITRTAADLTTGDIIDWQHTLHVVIRVTEPDQAGRVKIIAASYWTGDTTSIHASQWVAFTVHDGAVPPPDDAFAIYVKEGRGPDGVEVCGPACRVGSQWIVKDQPLDIRTAIGTEDICDWEYATVTPNSLLRAGNAALAEAGAPSIERIRHRMMKAGEL